MGATSTGDGRRTQRPGAFSLLELVVALAIFSLIMRAAALAWSEVDAALRLETALRQLASDLREAQTLALASASRVRLVFASGSAVYHRERADDDGRYEPDRTRALPPGIVVAGVNSGGDLVFAPRGQAENGTVVLGDRRGVQRALRLNQRGRVTVLAAGE